MRLLQAEHLRHHMVSGRMQEDPTRGQAHHDVASHRRQADRDGVWTCGGGANRFNGAESAEDEEEEEEEAVPNLLV